MLRSSYDVAVVGAGAFGAWTAWHLARAGRSVLLVDAWGPGHVRSSSGGESRAIRMGYGADEIYTRMSLRSLELWKDLARRTGQPLFHRTGVLFLARRDDPYSDATVRTLRAVGVSMEVIEGTELAARFPQMRLTDPAVYGIFEPGSGALMARRAVQAVVEDSGVEYSTAAVGLESMASIPAETFVFACGAWLPKLFPELLAGRINPTRQEIFFFAPPPGDSRFAPGRWPVWIEFSDPRGPYGFPDLESRGFKVGFDRHGAAFDPDSGDRRVSSEGLEEVQVFLAERFPAMAGAPLVESRVCQYESTSSGDFLIDRHPEFDNIWLAGGGSGHGFKHGPAVGEYLAARILGGGEVEARFSLESKGLVKRRTVY